jgi:hypothetical protein
MTETEHQQHYRSMCLDFAIRNNPQSTEGIVAAAAKFYNFIQGGPTETPAQPT